MNFGSGRPSVKVDGGGRSEAGSVTGVVSSSPVMRERLKRPMMMVAMSASRASEMSWRREAFCFGGLEDATAAEKPLIVWLFA